MTWSQDAAVHGVHHKYPQCSLMTNFQQLAQDNMQQLSSTIVTANFIMTDEKYAFKICLILHFIYI